MFKLLAQYTESLLVWPSSSRSLQSERQAQHTSILTFSVSPFTFSEQQVRHVQVWYGHQQPISTDISVTVSGPWPYLALLVTASVGRCYRANRVTNSWRGLTAKRLPAVRIGHCAAALSVSTVQWQQYSTQKYTVWAERTWLIVRLVVHKWPPCFRGLRAARHYVLSVFRTGQTAACLNITDRTGPKHAACTVVPTVMKYSHTQPNTTAQFHSNKIMLKTKISQVCTCKIVSILFVLSESFCTDDAATSDGRCIVL
jgi:hypothetical protein